MNITLVKILKYSIYLILGISILYLIYFINTEDPLKKKLRRELKSIYKNNTFSKHLLNDYREEFLPNTQFIKLEYKKIDLVTVINYVNNLELYKLRNLMDSQN